MVKGSKVRNKDICKQVGNTEVYKRILAVLEIGKMIPVKEDLCAPIKIDEIQDTFYQSLIRSEYRFLKARTKTILKKAINLYDKQKETGIIKPCYCNFEVLEKVCDEYSVIK